MDAKVFVDGIGELRAKVQPVVGDEYDGVPPQRWALFDEDGGDGGGGALGCCHCAHVGAAAEAVGEEEDVGVAAWGKGLRTDLIDANGDTGAVG